MTLSSAREVLTSLIMGFDKDLDPLQALHRDVQFVRINYPDADFLNVLRGLARDRSKFLVSDCVV
jgi:hypothetical protein